jgi:dTDP-4-amino-4,6-dideoxygalactose transaminase
VIPISKNWFGPEEFAAVQRPLNNGWVVQGKEVKNFEQAFSRFSGAQYSIACSSGTAALHIACAALGTSPGDEVIVPAFTWVATANVVELLGAKAVFCDIELDTFNIDTQQIAGCLTSETKGIVPVHLFGLCAEMTPIVEFARKHQLWLVEDAACGLGAWYRGKHAGTIGDAGCFSFHPRKSITTGEGGMVTVSDERLARVLDGLRNHGAVPSIQAGSGNTGHTALLPSFSMAGYNYRLTDIQGALGVAQMQRLNWLLEERHRCAKYYEEALADITWLRLPKTPSHQRHAWQSYVTLFAPEEPTMKRLDAMHEQRNRFMTYLESQGVSTRQGTHAPPHLDYYVQKYGYRPDDYPNAFLADRLSLALPIFPGMTEAELSFVTDCIRNYRLTKNS